MEDFFSWFTHMENTKPFVLVLFFVTFVGIILYVYTGKRRKQRLESYKHMPLQDDADDANRKGNEK